MTQVEHDVPAGMQGAEPRGVTCEEHMSYFRSLPGAGEPNESMVTLRVSKELHRALFKAAHKREVSMNQLCADILRVAMDGYLTVARESEVTNAAGEVS